jgi:NADPH:quinone reductase
MKHWRLEQFGSPEEVLHLEEAELPTPPAGQLALKVAAAGLTLPDLLLIKGQHPLIPQPPLTPGLKVSGEIGSG